MKAPLPALLYSTSIVAMKPYCFFPTGACNRRPPHGEETHSITSIFFPQSLSRFHLSNSSPVPPSLDAAGARGDGDPSRLRAFDLPHKDSAFPALYLSEDEEWKDEAGGGVAEEAPTIEEAIGQASSGGTTAVRDVRQRTLVHQGPARPPQEAPNVPTRPRYCWWRKTRARRRRLSVCRLPAPPLRPRNNPSGDDVGSKHKS